MKRNGALLGFALVALAAARPALAQAGGDARASYGSTLTFGTGLVSIPVAWISPGSGDLFVSLSARYMGVPLKPGKSETSTLDATETIEAHFAKRFSIGGSLYSTETQQVGFHAQVLLVEQPPSSPRWLPSIAIGVRNLGSSKYQDRFVTGSKRIVSVLPDSGRTSGRGVFNASPTLYGVATRDFQFASTSASFSLGYGNGLFKAKGDLDTLNNQKRSLPSGIFLGARYAIPWKETRLVSLMLENDGFDWNSGLQLTVGHLSVGFYVTELDEGKKIAANKPLAGFTKSALNFSYNASLPGIFDGSTQRAEAAEAQIALRRLEQEIAQRRIVTAKLVDELSKASTAADKASAGGRDLILKQLEAERAALKAAADRLEALQKKPPEPR